MKYLMCTLMLCSFSYFGHAATYQLTGVLTQVNIDSNDPFPALEAPNVLPVFSGVLQIEGDKAAFSGAIDNRIYIRDAIWGNLIIDGLDFTLTTDVVTERDDNYGGYGNVYHEGWYSESYISQQNVEVPDTGAHIGGAGSIFQFDLQGTTAVSFGRMQLARSEGGCTFYYDDYSQDGTPDSNCYDESWMATDEDLSGFSLHISYESASPDLYYRVDETYLVSVQEIPLPGAGVLFISALGVMSARVRRKGSLVNQ